LLENNEVDGERLKELIKNSGNSQEEMAKLLDYIKESKENARAREETPADEAWPEGQ
jgi:DNA-binding XRE family transcriptional regulator